MAPTFAMAFDDDDNILAGNPSNRPNAANDDTPAIDDAEDEVPDFKLFASLVGGRKNVSSQNIRRGEKDFEQHGTMAQDSTLESSRQAMDEILSHTRVHRTDAWTRAWYFPDTWANEPEKEDELWLRERCVAVEHAKGSWTRDIGRTIPAARDPLRASRLWLLPEEALWMVERGTVDLWWPDRTLEELLPPEGTGARGEEGYGPDDYDVGVPLSLEAAYSMLIGEEGERGKVSLPKYQVYSHLKRGGFHMARAPPGPLLPEVQGPSLLETFQGWIFSLIAPTPAHEKKVKNPWGPILQPGLYRSYRDLYNYLALTTPHKPVAQITHAETPEPEEPFKVFYYIWKTGQGPFSKAAPPPPDFRIAVTDTSDSFVPTLSQVDALLMSSAPHDPPSANPAWQNNHGRLYQRLRHGHRSLLIAVVDSGLVNFIRFGEGAFGEEKLYERFDNTNRGGKKCGRGGGRGGRGRGRGRGRR